MANFSAVRSKTLRINVISGVILILVALVAWREVAWLDMGTIRYLGPGMLPSGLSIILLAVGVVVLAIGIFQSGTAATYLRIPLRGPFMIAVALVAFAATIRGTDFAGIAIPQLGLVVAGPLAVIIAGYAGREANMRDLCAVAFGLTAACTALFNDLLGMAIPVLPKGLEAVVSSSIGWEMAARAAYATYAVIAVLIVVFIPSARAASSDEGGMPAND